MTDPGNIENGKGSILQLDHSLPISPACKVAQFRMFGFRPHFGYVGHEQAPASMADSEKSSLRRLAAR
jgi:hypothetical protein